MSDLTIILRTSVLVLVADFSLLAVVGDGGRHGSPWMTSPYDNRGKVVCRDEMKRIAI